jgi:hypothetical protein
VHAYIVIVDLKQNVPRFGEHLSGGSRLVFNNMIHFKDSVAQPEWISACNFENPAAPPLSAPALLAPVYTLPGDSQFGHLQHCTPATYPQIALAAE